MPYTEVVVLEGRGYELRLVGPDVDLWPGPTPGVAAPPIALTRYAVINQPSMVGRRLPMTNNPNSPDMVSGQWIGRLDDAGEMSIDFPNKEASDGWPWRYRFDTTGKRQWLEIYNDGYLESCCCIEIVTKARDKITISGHDGLFQLKGAYERDWITIQAPRDVIERGTQVWGPLVADSFPPGSYVTSNLLVTPTKTWTADTTSGANSFGTINVGNSGGIAMAVLSAATTSGNAILESGTISPASNTWTATASFAFVQYGTGGASNEQITIQINESTGDSYTLACFGFSGPNFDINGVTISALPQSALSVSQFNLRLESDGEWVSAFFNGQLVGTSRRVTTLSPTALNFTITLNASLGGSISAVLQGALVESLQPFLMRGTDKGDYVLPGGPTTYPSGGLHARYFNDADLASDTNRLSKIHSPNRTQTYAGSNTSEYANQQDAIISGQTNPLSGAATQNWSVIWFGAIWLNLSAGSYTLQVNNPFLTTTGTAVRVWIGKTQWGTQLMDQWTFASGGSGGNAFTVSASTLAGTLPYGGGTIQRDGWYPIKIEYAVDSTAYPAPYLFFTNVPIAYTDPGGTAIASGAQATIVPATSLSPLGCVDQRHQGISHFDLIQKNALAFGYQIACEPQQLESGLFPGICAPRIREGHDTDAILSPDDSPHLYGPGSEGLLNYSNKLDATDTCTSIAGNGATFQSGLTGQLQSEVFDPSSVLTALFDVQAWQDFSDAAELELLQALLNSNLGQRLSPWQVISGDPMGWPRLAFNWPLPSGLAEMRWRPGDGLRVQARDVGIFDLQTRQLLSVTRQIHPNGITGTQVNFSDRPRTTAKSIAQGLFQVTRLGRNKQKTITPLSGLYVWKANIPANTTYADNYSLLQLSSGDNISRVILSVSIISGTAPSIGVQINGVDETTALNGPWGMPAPSTLTVDITSVTHPTIEGRIFVTLINKSLTNAVNCDWQIFVDVTK